MSPPEKFRKFDIAAVEFIGYRIMSPTMLMTIMRKYFSCTIDNQTTSADYSITKIMD